MTTAAATTPPDTEPDYLYEVVDGRYVEIPHMGAKAAWYASVLSYLINTFAIPRRLGLSGSEILFQLRPGSPERRPDVVFVSQGRWNDERFKSGDPASMRSVPDLAVEVVSPTNTSDAIEEKTLEYFAAGVTAVWVIHPLRKRVYVYDSPTKVRILTEADELDATPAVPGFKLNLREYFATVEGMGREG
jgi:Uma2 family endonuclease